MRIKKLLSLALVMIMILTSAMSVMADTNATTTTTTTQIPQIEKFYRQGNVPKLQLDPRNNGYNDNDQVRIIVELDNAPLAEFAAQKGVMVNELNADSVTKVTNELYATQDSVKKDIQSKGIDMEYQNSFVNVVNGFSGTTTFGEAKKIELLPGVKQVTVANEYMRPEPDMNTSVDIVNAPETWTYGLKGEGMVVAIVDTGIDTSHKDMVLSLPADAEGSKAKLTEDGVNAIIAEEKLPGQFFTDKVPYGYNYYDNNLEVRDLGPGASMHGMHVAGTVGANGDADGIKGIAPEAQLLAMKVFSNDPDFPSTFSDMIIKAIDDSVKLGADVINMSLGSTAAFVLPTDPEQMAVTRAAEAGVLLSVSAGNSNKLGSGYINPFPTNPDVAVVGSPGLTAETLQVASIENTNVKTTALEYNDGTKDVLAGYFAAGPTNPVVAFEGQPIQYVDCGLGGVADFAGKDLAGKIALVERGTYNFVVKIANAEDAGAAGIIVWNSATGGEGLISMAYPEDDETIPAVFIPRSHGLALKGLIGTENANVTFNGVETIAVNSEAGKMSSFTSWGPTPDLEFKPEITAPGGMIYSTFNNNTYGLMSGTSMAAPHVSGGSALMMEKIATEFPELTGIDKVNMAKNILMSTAHPLSDKGKYNVAEMHNNYSPRRQGAGVMDLFAAVNTKAVVYDKETKLSKVNLKQIGDESTFVLTVQNFGDEDVTYSVEGNAQTDLMLSGNIYDPLTGKVVVHDLISNEADTVYAPGYGSPLSFEGLGNGGVITVPAGKTADITVKLNLTNAFDWGYEASLDEIFPNGTFVEGFVQLKPVIEGTPSLSIPYVGFYGEWDKAPIIDGDIYGIHKDSYYGMTGLLSNFNEDLDFNYRSHGEDVVVAISPDGDNWADEVVPILSFLRNAKEVSIDIYSADGKTKLRHIATDTDVRKDYYDSGNGSMYKILDRWTWDGTVNNKLVADGTYIYRITSKIDFAGAESQVYDLPVNVDTTAPVITKCDYNEDTHQLTVVANDGENPIYDYILIDLNNPDSKPMFSEDGVFDLSDYKNDVMQLLPIVQDQAYNQAYEMPFYVNDHQIAYIYMNNPEPFVAYTTNEIPVNGYVTDESGLASLSIGEEGNMQDLDFNYDEKTGRFYFDTTLELENGLHIIDVDATDNAGNTINFERTIYVDTDAPAISMTEIPTERIVDNSVESVALKGQITDIFNSLRVVVNGNEVFYDKPEEELADQFTQAITYDLDEQVALEVGDNLITVSAQDYAGNISTVQYKVYRKAVGEADPDLNEDLSIDSVEVLNGTNVSYERPVTISAVANQEADWTVTVKNPNGDTEQVFEQTGVAFAADWAPNMMTRLNGEYTVEITAEYNDQVVTQEASFMVYNYPIEIKSVNLMQQNGFMAVEAEILNLGPSATNPMLIVQVLDSNGYVVNISTARMNGLLKDQTINLSSGFGLNTPGIYQAEVFVWTGWDNIEALSSPKTVTFTIH